MPGTDVVVLARDEIAEDVGAFVVGEAEVAVKHVSRGGRHRVFGEQSSPREITGISRPHRPPELLAHHGVSAVGTDQKVARFASPILKLCSRRPRLWVLIDPHERLRLVIVLVSEGRLQGRINERP